ncbi:MAG: ergothioneine biosynthesis protein EgtB [Rhodothermales bacterium]|nr:ergothioneine biosynthesis protein EgtB [Rhodothermales bacterium]
MPVAAPPVSERAAFLRRPLAEQYAHVRAFTERLCEPLATEDYVVQSMTDVSPTKWHLAHTTWFWETFVLREYLDGYALYDERYPYLFNSYYVQAGERHCRAQRGYLSRPTVEEVFAFRRYVDEHVQRLLSGLDEGANARLAAVVRVGLNHEQQHQELMLTDVKHVFSVNPLRPAYRDLPGAPAPDPGPLRFVAFEGGLVEIGYDAERDGPFTFDNETPRHRHFLEPYALADRLVTCGEYVRFMEDGGYDRRPLWLDAGWATREAEAWTEPFYWERRDGQWWHFTLGGMRPVDPHEPVTHLSYFEADAFARWAAEEWPGARLPTEFEWEAAARGVPEEGTFVESGRLHPAPAEPVPGGDGAPAAPRLRQLYGDAWEWTRSAYAAYPGYAPEPGALGEYNGKWMCGQFVLRGGSCATSRTHIRPTYRNFFHPAATWQFTGLRLARDL